MTVDLVDEDLAGPADARLTRRELVVLTHLHRGLTLDEIAERCFVSRNTVKTQVRSLYRKLGVSSRAEAVAMVGTRVPAPAPVPHLRLAPAPPSSGHGGRDRDAPAPAGRSRDVRRAAVAAGTRPPAARAVPPAGTGAVGVERGAAWPARCGRLARLAAKRAEVQRVMEALDSAIAAEVAAERSRGAGWTEVGAALGTDRHAARRQYDHAADERGGRRGDG